MKLYLHKSGHGEPRLIDVEESATVAAIVTEHGDEIDRAWLEDGDELVVERTIVEVVQERAHIYVGPCRQVAVTVRYGGPDGKTRNFKPSTTVKAVFGWVAGPEGFSLPTSQLTNFGLFLPGARTPLDTAEHIALVATDCHVTVDLAEKHRHQG